ncbi:hypothetical protein [Paenibacillus dendritiformis]|uniref:hypothetical protein n=1 Tax=Paenibacillus dendritiformis TaxID=130049 RepID=UPI00387E0EC3
MNPLLVKLALEAFARNNLQYAEIGKRALDPKKWAAGGIHMMSIDKNMETLHAA